MEALVARRVGRDVANAALAFAQRPTTRRRLDRSGLDACRIATLALALHLHLHPCLQACVPYKVRGRGASLEHLMGARVDDRSG